MLQLIEQFFWILPEKVEEKINLVEESPEIMDERSNDAQEKDSYQGQSLQVLLKFGDLSNKLQVFFFPLSRLLMCLHIGILEDCFLI